MGNYRPIYKMSIYGVLVSIIFLLTFTPLGYPPIGPINATIIHIPVIIAIIYFCSLKTTLFFGFIFGFSSFVKVWIAPTTPLDFMFLNPLVSIVPRIIMSLVTLFVYKKSKYFKVTASALIGSFANSVLVIGSFWILYEPAIVKITKMSVLNFIFVFLTMPIIVEAILSVLIITPFIKILEMRQK